MSFADFRKKLEKKDSPEHAALLAHARGLIDTSRDEMAKNYSAWDRHDAVFRSKVRPDKEDRNAHAKGQPGKLIVPLTFSQIMTFVAHNIMTITQNKRFFELEPTGSEDNPLTEPLELILERDLRRNQWTTFLVQFFLDIGRFSLGVGEVCYKEDYRYVRLAKTDVRQNAFGGETEEISAGFEQIPTFVGNRIYPVSPYRFYPDVGRGLPMSRFQEGEFCGSEDVFSMSSLRGDKNLFNLDKIPVMDDETIKNRKAKSRIGEFKNRGNPNMGNTAGTSNGEFVKSGQVVITKMVLDIVPKDFEVGDGNTKLGDEDFPVRYVLWYANDGKIVRFEEAYYLHGMFPYFLGQFLPDQHQTVNEGLADVCDQLTSLVTWKLNAHVTSQRNTVESKWIVDPAGIDMRSLESRSPYIFLRKNASQMGVDKYIKQFATVDVTANVMNDISALSSLLDMATGFANMSQGQHSSGRRSATQDRVVAQGASARSKTTLGGIWDTSFEVLGKQLIANNRQEMDEETFTRIMGVRQWPVNPETGVPFTTQEIFLLFKADPVAIATSEDFFVFDATLPSEKAFLAQSLQEIFMSIMSNPQFAAVLGFDANAIRELFNQIYLLRGVTPARLPSPPPAGAPGLMPPNVVPGPSPANSAVS